MRETGLDEDNAGRLNGGQLRGPMLRHSRQTFYCGLWYSLLYPRTSPNVD